MDRNLIIDVNSPTGKILLEPLTRYQTSLGLNSSNADVTGKNRNRYFFPQDEDMTGVSFTAWQAEQTKILASQLDILVEPALSISNSQIQLPSPTVHFFYLNNQELAYASC